MKRRSYILLILAILVMVVVLLRNQPRQVVEASYVSPSWHLPIDTSKVVKIGIRRGASSVIVERKHGAWRHEQGDRERADNLMINRLLEGIANFRLLGLVSTNPRKQDVFEVGESGTSVIVTTDDGREVSLVVGKMSSLAYRSYVRAYASDTVYLASGLTPELIGGEAFPDLRSTVFHVDSTSILTIAIRASQTAFTVHREGQSWFSGQTQIPNNLMLPIIASLQQIRAKEASGRDTKHGQNASLSLDVQGGKRVRMEFYTRDEKDGSCIMKTTLSSLLYVVDFKATHPFLQLVGFVSSPKSIVAKAKTTTATRPISSDTLSVEDVAKSSPDNEGVLAIHKVKHGETLASIAQEYNVSVEQLKQWNLLTTDAVDPGTELYVFVK